MASSVEQASARFQLLLESVQQRQVWAEYLRRLPLVYDTVQQPHFWTDPIRHPSFQFQGLDFPAYILPVTITLLFPLWPLILNKISATYAKPIYRPDRKHIHASDLEHNGPDSAGEGRVLKIGKYLLNLYYIGCIPQLFNHIGDPEYLKAVLTPLGFSQTFVVLITAYIYNTHHVPAILAAAGWLGLAFQHPPGVPASIAIVLLALPDVLMHPGMAPEHMYAPGTNGSFLIALVCNYYIPLESPLRSYKIWKFELWTYLAFAVLPVKELVRYLCGGSASEQEDATKTNSFSGKNMSQGADSNASGENSTQWGEIIVLLPTIIGTLAWILLVAAGAILAADLSMSCLGWRWVVEDRAATAPALISVGIFGAIIFMLMFSLCAVIEYRSPSTEMPLLVFFVHHFAWTAEILTWCVTSFNIVYLVALGVKLFRNAGRELAQKV